MRFVAGVVSIVFGSLFVACFPLYFWVPHWKAALLGYGTTVSSGELVLITVSDLVVNYFYLIIPGLLLLSIGTGKIAFAEDSESPSKKS